MNETRTRTFWEVPKTGKARARSSRKVGEAEGELWLDVPGGRKTGFGREIDLEGASAGLLRFVGCAGGSRGRGGGGALCFQVLAGAVVRDR